MSSEWTIFDLNQQVIGSGPKTASDLSDDQARQAMEQMLCEEVHPATLGVFLLANRWKKNNPEELIAYTETMREQSVKTAEPDSDPVDCGANYDGKVSTALFGVAAGAISAAAGTPVVAHGGDRVPTKHGDTYKHVLDELGVRTELEPEESARMTDETGFGFYYQSKFNPAVDELVDVRNKFGVRTLFNTIESFANPANAKVHLGSFYHLPYAKKTIDTLTGSKDQDVERIVMFQGLEGYDDIRPGYTKVAEWQNGELTDYEIETDTFGMDFDEEALEVDDIAADSARMTENVLSGNRDGPFREATLLNAAIRLYGGGSADSLEEGYEIAEEQIENGMAAGVLQNLRSF